MVSRKYSPYASLKKLALSFAICMLIFSSIGGSLAWLMTSTDPIVNVFTYGDIQIKLEETTGDRYKMTPGKVIEKDPTITVLADSEDCWLFVKIEESEDKKLSDYIEYTVADGWTVLEGVPGVYFRAVDNSDQAVSFSILKDNQVEVKGSVTREMLEILDDSNYPKLTFTGYAVQRDAEIAEIDTAAEAWLLVSGN
jgi:hypothetical protein